MASICCDLNAPEKLLMSKQIVGSEPKHRSAASETEGGNIAREIEGISYEYREDNQLPHLHGALRHFIEHYITQ